MKIYLHAGVPRTATTVLQRDVFPNLQQIRFIGKDARNSALQGRLFPLRQVVECCDRIRGGDAGGLEHLRRVLPTILKSLKIAFRDNHVEQVRQLCPLWATCVRHVAELLPDMPVLYSDESLCESMSGITGHPEHGDGVPLQGLRDVGFLKDVTLSVVLRESSSFLKASYYKAMEFEHHYGRPPFSYDEYIRRQMVVHERSPSASRIFLARQRTAAAHFRSLCPSTVVVTYDELAASTNVVDTLLGTRTGEAPVSLASLPRENSSWRNPETNAFILSAPGVPAGISIEQYAATFPETLQRFGLDRLFADESLGAGAPAVH
jgi:hypothetical protein